MFEIFKQRGRIERRNVTVNFGFETSVMLVATSIIFDVTHDML
jgi:hypothetical protein